MTNNAQDLIPPQALPKGAGPVTLNCGKGKKQIDVFAKLMSISSGLKKNILPRQHQDINSIYKKRLQKYLNLVAIHGENNAQIVDQIYKGE